MKVRTAGEKKKKQFRNSGFASNDSQIAGIIKLF